MSKRAEEYNKEFDAMYGDHTPDLPSSKAEQRALETYPITMVQRRYDGIARSDDYYDSNRRDRYCFQEGYEQAEKDIKEAIIKHFKYKQDHSPEHTLPWWVYKNVIDKVNEL